MRRQTVIHVRQKLSTSERRTCNVLGVARSTMTYQSKDRDEDALRHDIIRLAKMYGRYMQFPVSLHLHSLILANYSLTV